MSRKIHVGKSPCKPINTWEFHKLPLLGLAFGFLFLLSSTSYAQEYSSANTKAVKAYEDAINAFDKREYTLALAHLDEALNKDKNFIEAHLLQFEIYSELGEYQNAAEALRASHKINPDFFANTWFFLAAIEMGNAEYKEAQDHFNRFLKYPNPNPEMAKAARKELKNCEFAIEALKNPVDFDPKNIGIAMNSPKPEYYPCISADGGTMIFTRLIDNPNAFRGKDEDFFISGNKDGEWYPAAPLKSINTDYNEGAPTLSADGRTLVFTACETLGDYGQGRNGYGSCDLFISEKVDGNWQPPVNVGAPVNTTMWETQPSLSSDGQTLYFVRGMPSRPEGVKNQDIYYSTKKRDGTWSNPFLVSDKINTPYKEESVHIHPDGQTLYFSSNGHPGMGGLDLYVSYRDETGEWQSPVNLGYPINTHNDENSLLVSADGVLAFFASDREGGYGDLDLYSFELPLNVRPYPVTYAKGRVIDAETRRPVKATLRLANVNSERDTMNFGNDPVSGNFLVALSTADSYAMTVKSPGYLIHSETFDLNDTPQEGGYSLTVKMHKIAEGSSLVLKNVFFDTDSASLKTQSKPELMELAGFLKDNSTVKVELGGHTDNQGNDAYNLNLSKSRAEAVKQFLVTEGGIESERISTKGYGSSSPIADNATEEGRSQNRRTEFKITGI